MIEARGRCNAECARAVASGIRLIMRLFMQNAGWWAVGALGGCVIGGLAWWGWDRIMDWWER